MSSEGRENKRERTAKDDAPSDPFRSNFRDLLGFRIERWEPDLACLGLTVDGRHLNRSGRLHGGVLTSLIDSACGLAGCYRKSGQEPLRAMTLSMSAQFLAGAAAGDRLVAEAHCSSRGKTIYFARCQVRDQRGRLIGQGDGTFKYQR
jgi:uncharacterized protein (TIGR00369 family)